MGLLHLGGGICKTYKFCAKINSISAEFRLQKYASKGAFMLCKSFCKTLEECKQMKIGYARVSTQDRKLDLQLRALKKAGCQKIFREKVSGFSRQRLEFQRMLDQIRPGDVIIVWKLDRPASPALYP